MRGDSNPRRRMPTGFQVQRRRPLGYTCPKNEIVIVRENKARSLKNFLNQRGYLKNDTMDFCLIRGLSVTSFTLRAIIFHRCSV